MAEPIVRISHLSSWYGRGRARTQVLRDVSLELAPGEALGVVGESGSGKSTLAKCVLGMVTDTAGTLEVNSPRPQMVFQDPYGSLNPAKTVGWILEEPLRAAGVRDKAERRERVRSFLPLVGLEGEVLLCVPLGEVAYCSSDRNHDTISIEVCHPDDTGEFTPESYAALVRLVDWLEGFYGLSPEDVIRHYDVTGKLCPRYYVEHPGAWEAFQKALAEEEAVRKSGEAAAR